MATCSTNGGSWTTVSLEVNEVSVNHSDNSSTVNWVLALQRQYTINSSATKNGEVYIDNVKVWSGGVKIGGGAGRQVLASGSRTIKHNDDGSKTIAFRFSQELNVTLSGVYYGTFSASGSLTLTTTKRQATITNCPSQVSDEDDYWFELSNPGNYPVECWLEINPTNTHYAIQNVDITKNRHEFILTEEERNQLRKACQDNQGILRIGIYTNNNTSWVSYKDIPFSIIHALPVLDEISYQTTNYQHLTGDYQTVIAGYSDVEVILGYIQAKKQSTITEYGVTCGNQTIKKITLDNPFILSSILHDEIICQIIDSRNNTCQKTITINDYINYVPPVIDEVQLIRNQGGIGTNVSLTLKGTMWIGNFGVVDNSIQVSYFYKEQGSQVWLTGDKEIVIDASAVFEKTIDINGDLGTLGFDAGKNYDFKIVIEDCVTEVSKELLLSSGMPTVAYHPHGVSFGAFYNDEEGGPLQLSGINIMNMIVPVGSNITNSRSDFDPNEYYPGTIWQRIKGKVVIGVDEEDEDFHEADLLGGEKVINLLHNHTVDSHYHATGIGSDGNAIFVSGAPYGSSSASGAWNGSGVWTKPRIAMMRASMSFASYENGAARFDYTSSSSPGTNSKLSQEQSILQPYITKYIWERIA